MDIKIKRKNNKKFRLTSLLLICLIFLSSSYDGLAKAGSSITNQIFGPINKFNYSLSSTIMNQIEETFGSRQTREEVNRLQEENNNLRQLNDQLMATINREDFLKNEVAALSANKNLIQAQVTSKDLNTISQTFNIDKGKNDGVERGDIILEAIGTSDSYTAIVGKVTEVYPSYAQVLTIQNIANDVSFIDSNSGDYGVIDTYQSDTLKGYMVDVDSNVKKGDALLTTGIGGVYPDGLYIGTVTNVSMSQDSMRKNVAVKSDVDFSHIYRVLIMKGLKDE